MTLARPLLICVIAAFSAALTIGLSVTTPKRGPRPFLTEEPRMLDLLKMGNSPANIELIETPEGARASVSRETQVGNESGSANPWAMDTFIVR